MSVEGTRDRPTGAAMVGLALLGVAGWAIFANGATSLPNEARLQITIAALALVTLAGLLFSPRVRLRAPVKALVGLALLVLFAAWSGLSLDWSLAPDLSWVQLNRWAAYALFTALALVVGSSVRDAPRRTAVGYLLLAGLVALYAIGGKVVPWVEIPGLIDLDTTRDFSRLRAPVGYWNALALVGVLATPLAVRVAADPQARPRLRSLAVAILLLLLVTLGLTYSRGGILSLLAALALLIGIGPDRVRLAAYTGLGVAAALPAYAVAVIRDDLTTDGLALAERADDGLILLAALVVGAVGALFAARRLRAVDERLTLPERPRRMLSGRNAVAVAGVALLIAVGALAVSENGVTGTVEERWQDFTSTKYDPQTDPSRVLRANSGNRWVWWREAVGAFWDEPLRGWGAGSFPLVHRRYRDNELEVRQAHSVPLQFLAETGIVGALLALGGLGLLGWAAAARLRLTRGRERHYTAALLCAAFAWGIHMWFDWDTDIPGVTLPLLGIVGVLAARPPGASDAIEAVPPPDEPRAPAGPRAAGLLAGALVLAALATSAYLPWLADEKAADATIISVSRSDAALAEAAKRADEAIQLNPLSIDPVLAAVTIAQRRGRYEEVTELLEKAVARQPENPDVWQRLYVVQQLTGDVTARMEAVRRIVELDPHDSSIPFDAVVGDVSGESATATGTPLVETVIAPPPPPIGPPAPDSRILIGPERPVSSGGTTVEPVSPETPGSAPDRP